MSEILRYRWSVDIVDVSRVAGENWRGQDILWIVNIGFVEDVSIPCIVELSVVTVNW